MVKKNGNANTVHTLQTNKLFEINLKHFRIYVAAIGL